jgi:hypothetical protein
METEAPDQPGQFDDLGPEQGGGPPLALPWTLIVEGEHGWSADLEHGALLPRTGELIEFIGEAGDRRAYRVRAVVHTLQPSASERPPVRAEDSGPNSTVSGSSVDYVPTALRAGLPRVHVVEEG